MSNCPEQMLSIVVLARHVRDAQAADKIAIGWKMSTEQRRELVFVCQNRENRLSLNEIKKRVACGLFTQQNAVNILAAQDRWDEYREFRDWGIPSFPVSGTDIMEEFNLEPGPAVGQALGAARSVWAESNFCLGKQAILELINGRN